LGAVAFGASSVSAQSADGAYPSIITKIAERFSLNQDEVKAVFDEERASHQAEMQQQNEEMLTAAVAAGELTEEQKQAILAKHAEMKTARDAQMESMQSLTQEERQAAMVSKRSERETQRAELEAWAEAQGIDMKYSLMGGNRGHSGMGGPGFHGQDDATIETDTEVEQE
jgi:hypothetical protein